MQWTNDRKFEPETQTDDVYQDVQPSYSATVFGAETQDFTIDSIQQKLGPFIPLQEEDDVSSRADVKPSNQTLKLSYSRDYAAEQSAAKTKMATKNKVMLASYVVVVLALVLAVTLCGVSVTGSFTSATALNGEYIETASKLEELSALTAEDYAALTEKAAELGYIDASRSNTQTYTEIKTRPAQNFHVETNWFDSLCDWFSGAFGD